MSDRMHSAEKDADALREVIWRMAEDITRLKVTCAQGHPPKMGSPTRDWPAGTETRHSDGSRCVLLNDGDWARVLPPGGSDA